MLFNSLAFFVYLPVVVLLFWVLPRRYRNLFLLAASYFFYGWWDPRFLLLMFLSTSIDFYAAIRVEESKTPRARKGWITFSVVSELSILGTFKYFDFFSRSLGDAMGALGFTAHPYLLDVVLPVGISFYTFQALSYTVDVYRGHAKAQRRFFDFALFVSFFPQLVAGPIERARDLMPQLQRDRTFADVDVSRAAHLILWGFYKKVFIADNLAPIVARLLDTTPQTGAGVFVGVLAFAFQIYADFSGYTDIARGSALLVGVDLSPNFRNPYFALSPSDFWERWHISLSRWLRDYLYISLGGSRAARWKIYRNLMLTMVLGGLWHGAAWNYVLWGMFHGGILVGYRLLFGKTGRPAADGVMARAALMALMFVLTLGGWLLFRATSGAHVVSMVSALATGSWAFGPFAHDLVTIAFASLPLVAVMAAQELSGDMFWPLRLRWAAATPFYTYLVAAVALFGATGEAQFIYFQF